MNNTAIEFSHILPNPPTIALSKDTPSSQPILHRRKVLKLLMEAGIATGSAYTFAETRRLLEYFTRIIPLPLNYVEMKGQQYIPSFVPFSKEIKPLLKDGKAFDIQKSEFVEQDRIGNATPLLRSTPVLSTAGMQDTLLQVEYFQDPAFLEFIERVRTSFEQQLNPTDLTEEAQQLAFIKHTNRMIDNELTDNYEAAYKATREKIPFKERIVNEQTMCFEQALYLSMVLGAAFGYKTDMLYFAWKNPRLKRPTIHAVLVGNCNNGAIIADPTLEPSISIVDSFQNYFVENYANDQIYKRVWVDSIFPPQPQSLTLAADASWITSNSLEPLNQEILIKSVQSYPDKTSGLR